MSSIMHTMEQDNCVPSNYHSLSLHSTNSCWKTPTYNVECRTGTEALDPSKIPLHNSLAAELKYHQPFSHYHNTSTSTSLFSDHAKLTNCTCDDVFPPKSKSHNFRENQASSNSLSVSNNLQTSEKICTCPTSQNCAPIVIPEYSVIKDSNRGLGSSYFSNVTAIISRKRSSTDETSHMNNHDPAHTWLTHVAAATMQRSPSDVQRPPSDVPSPPSDVQRSPSDVQRPPSDVPNPPSDVPSPQSDVPSLPSDIQRSPSDVQTSLYDDAAQMYPPDELIAPVRIFPSHKSKDSVSQIHNLSSTLSGKEKCLQNSNKVCSLNKFPRQLFKDKLNCTPLQSICGCEKLKCGEKFSKNWCRQLYYKFWDFERFNIRKQWILNHTAGLKKKYLPNQAHNIHRRKWFMPSSDGKLRQVCKLFFLRTISYKWELVLHLVMQDTHLPYRNVLPNSSRNFPPYSSMDTSPNSSTNVLPNSSINARPTYSPRNFRSPNLPRNTLSPKLPKYFYPLHSSKDALPSNSLGNSLYPDYRTFEKQSNRNVNIIRRLIFMHIKSFLRKYHFPFKKSKGNLKHLHEYNLKHLHDYNLKHLHDYNLKHLHDYNLVKRSFHYFNAIHPHQEVSYRIFCHIFKIVFALFAVDCTYLTIMPNVYLLSQAYLSCDLMDMDQKVASSDKKKLRLETEKFCTEKNQLNTEKSYLDTEKSYFDTRNKSNSDTDTSRLVIVKNFLNNKKRRVNKQRPNADKEKPHLNKNKFNLNTEKPCLNTEKPCLNTEKPCLNTEKPCLNTEKPCLNTEKPCLNTEKSHFDREKLQLNTEYTSHSDSDKSCLVMEKPHLNKYKPHLNTDKLHLNTDKPHLDTENPHLNTEKPHSDTERPHLNADKPHLNTDKPHLGTDKPHLGTDKPHLNTEKHHSDTERPHLNADKPHLNTDKPHLDTDKPHLCIQKSHLDKGTTPENPKIKQFLSMNRNKIHYNRAQDKYKGSNNKLKNIKIVMHLDVGNDNVVLTTNASDSDTEFDVASKNNIAVNKCEPCNQELQGCDILNKTQLGKGCIREENPLLVNCTCKRQCFSTLSETRRQEIYTSFWNIGDCSQQKRWIVEHIHRIEHKRRAKGRKRETRKCYFLIDEIGQPVVVCAVFFQRTLGFSDGNIFDEFFEGPPRDIAPSCSNENGQEKQVHTANEMFKKDVEMFINSHISMMRSRKTDSDNVHPGTSSDSKSVKQVYKSYIGSHPDYPISYSKFRLVYLKTHKASFQQYDICEREDGNDPSVSVRMSTRRTTRSKSNRYLSDKVEASEPEKPMRRSTRTTRMQGSMTEEKLLELDSQSSRSSSRSIHKSQINLKQRNLFDSLTEKLKPHSKNSWKYISRKSEKLAGTESLSNHQITFLQGSKHITEVPSLTSQESKSRSENFPGNNARSNTKNRKSLKNRVNIVPQRREKKNKERLNDCENLQPTINKKQIKTAQNLNKHNKLSLLKKKNKHILLPPCNCNRRKCIDNIPDERRYQIHKQFWNLNSYRDRKRWLMKYVEKQERKIRVLSLFPQRKNESKKYFLPDKNDRIVEVCRLFFIHTLGFKWDSVVDAAVRDKSQSNAATDDIPHCSKKPLRQLPEYVVDSVKNYLKSLQDSHVTGNSETMKNEHEEFDENRNELSRLKVKDLFKGWKVKYTNLKFNLGYHSFRRILQSVIDPLTDTNEEVAAKKQDIFNSYKDSLTGNDNLLTIPYLTETACTSNKFQYQTVAKIKSNIEANLSDLRTPLNHNSSTELLNTSDYMPISPKYSENSKEDAKSVHGGDKDYILNSHDSDYSDQCTIIDEDCNESSDQCTIIAEDCNDSSDQCTIIAEDCNNSSDQCTIIAEDCNDSSDQCTIIAEDCNDCFLDVGSGYFKPIDNADTTGKHCNSSYGCKYKKHRSLSMRNDRSNYPVLPPCKCRKRKCYEKFTDTQRQKINDTFWSLDSYNERKQYILEHIKRADIKRRVVFTQGTPRKLESRWYYLPDDSGRKVDVCKAFFLRTLGYRWDSIIDTIGKTTPKGEKWIVPDKRGRKPPPHKISEEAVNSMTLYIENVCQTFKPECQKKLDNNKKGIRSNSCSLIPYGLTMKQLFEDYKSKHQNHKFGYESFRKIFRRVHAAHLASQPSYVESNEELDETYSQIATSVVKDFLESTNVDCSSSFHAEDSHFNPSIESCISIDHYAPQPLPPPLPASSHHHAVHPQQMHNVASEQQTCLYHYNNQTCQSQDMQSLPGIQAPDSAGPLQHDRYNSFDHDQVIKYNHHVYCQPTALSGHFSQMTDHYGYTSCTNPRADVIDPAACSGTNQFPPYYMSNHVPLRRQVYHMASQYQNILHQIAESSRYFNYGSYPSQDVSFHGVLEKQYPYTKQHEDLLHKGSTNSYNIPKTYFDSSTMATPNPPINYHLPNHIQQEPTAMILSPYSNETNLSHEHSVTPCEKNEQNKNKDCSHDIQSKENDKRNSSKCNSSFKKAKTDQPKVKKERKLRRKSARNYGNNYPMLSPCHCKKKKCTERFPESDRQRIHNMFWDLNDYNERKQWMLLHIKRENCRRRRIDQIESFRKQESRWYFFPDKDGQQHEVCKDFFLRTLGYKWDSVIDTIRRTTPKGQISSRPDQRGRKAPAHKLSKAILRSVIQYIQSMQQVSQPATTNCPIRDEQFRNVEDHTVDQGIKNTTIDSKGTSVDKDTTIIIKDTTSSKNNISNCKNVQIAVPYGLTMKDLYDDYKTKYSSHKIGYESFRRIFRALSNSDKLISDDISTDTGILDPDNPDLLNFK